MISTNEKPYANEAALWKAILCNQKQAWLKMHTGSMYPLMPIGAFIFVNYFQIAHQKIRAGDIVLYIDDNQLVAHRILKVNLAKNQCLQGGDNAVYTSLICIDNIIGVVEKVKINEKEFDMSSRASLYFRLYITISSLAIGTIKQYLPKVGYLLHRVKIRLAYKMVKYLL